MCSLPSTLGTRLESCSSWIWLKFELNTEQNWQDSNHMRCANRTTGVSGHPDSDCSWQVWIGRWTTCLVLLWILIHFSSFVKISCNWPIGEFKSDCYGWVSTHHVFRSKRNCWRLITDLILPHSSKYLGETDSNSAQKGRQVLGYPKPQFIFKLNHEYRQVLSIS